MKIDTTTGVNEMYEEEYKGLPEIGHVLIAVRYRDGNIYKSIGTYIHREEREADDFFDGRWADDQVEWIDGVAYVRPGWFAVSLDHDPAYANINGDVVGWKPLPEFGDGTDWNKIEEAKR